MRSLEWSGLALWVALASFTGCARSALPLGSNASGPEVAGSSAMLAPQPSEAEPPCPACGEGLEPKQSLACLCRTAQCPRDLDRALSKLDSFVAFGKGCDYAWLIQRIGYGYDVFVFTRSRGELVYAQHTSGDHAVTCEDGSQQLLLEGGEAPECSTVDWCRFAHVDFTIGIGELDTVRTCNESTFR